MSDPATEAAQRAAVDGRLRDDLMIPGLSVREFGVSAAREALAPIRELHRPWKMGQHTYCTHCNEHCKPVRKAYWPCATARLVYTSDELGGE